MTSPGYFEYGTILCPTIESVEQVNDFILSLLSVEEITYLSSDRPCQSDENQANGLCNGTRLQIIDLKKNVICATVLTRSNIGDKIFISRMNLIPSDTSITFKFQRRQFPVALCFGMTINKS